MIKSIYDTHFSGQRVLVRVDFNEPLDENLKIADDTKIVESLPTIDKIIDDGGIPILISHLGRPKGERNLKYSLKPAAEVLQNRYGYNVIFADDCIGDIAKEAVNRAKLGDVVLLENLRFYKEEEKNDLEFARKLASLADVYVNEAFSTDHRAHASIEQVALLFQHRFAGKMLMDEIEYLGKTLKNPQRPFTAVIGGAKISGKIDVIKSLFAKCDTIIIGGGMMFTFFKAEGLEIGKSILEEDKIQLAQEILCEAKEKNIKLLLPVDVVVADAFANEANTKFVQINEIPADWIGMDIGAETQKLFEDEIIRSRTIVWNGPMGVFEMPNFAKGTNIVANALAKATTKGAITIVGGGDSAAAIQQMNLKNKITHVSTGGGASLDFLEGKVMPGIAVLK